MSDDTKYKTHAYAIEWPTLSGAEKRTFATLTEAQEQLPLYGPTAYVIAIEPVAVPVG